MIPEEQQRLVALGFAPDVIARAGEVLAVWGVERLFATCAHCGKACIDPDLPRGRRLRKKLPADLFHRWALVGCRDGGNLIACQPCEFVRFEYG